MAPPADLLGFAWRPDGSGADVAVLRLGLVALALLCALLELRGRHGPARVALLAMVVVGVGFWVLALGRPWGVLVDPVATRRAAEVAVAAAGTDPAAGVLALTQAGAIGWRALVELGWPARFVLALPSLLPLGLFCALVLATATLAPERVRAGLGAGLLVAGATSELQAAQGFGLLSGWWRYPEAGLAVTASVLGLLLIARLPGKRPLRLALAALLTMAWLAVPVGVQPPHPDGALLLLTLDQQGWLVAAALGLVAGVDLATGALLAGGGVLVLGASLGLPVDAWGGHALYRIGVVYAAALAVSAHAPRLGAAIGRTPIARLGGEPAALVRGLLLAVLLPGSLLVWWNPLRTDRVALASAEPVSAGVTPVMDWIRAETPPDAIFLASPAYSPSVAVRAGRRVLRAAELARPADAGARVQAERQLLRRWPLPESARRFGVSYILAAPGDFRARGLDRPGQLVGRPGLELVYEDDRGFHVFRMLPHP